nr:aminopeptidase [Chitinispirillaceae bacterium]
MYQPSQEILEKYASVLVSFALNDGEGIKKNDVVLIGGQTPGMPLIREVYRAVIRSGGHPIMNIMEDDLALVKLSEAGDGQLSFFPEKYYRGIADTIDHSVRILADRDPLFLAEMDPRRIMLNTRSTKPYRDWLDLKEDAGKFTWTLCLYGTEGLAKEAGMSVEAYWEQIENACFLREADPIAKWKSVYAEMSRILTVLNEMPVDSIRIESK